MSVYIHIPFCTTICSYCDFCKLNYNEKWADEYLKILEKEVTQKYRGEKVSTIYVGGGTPSSLNCKQLLKLFQITNLFNKDEEVEFTFECNLENISEEKLKILYENKVNRLSIGIQTFNDKFLKYLNRNHTNDMIVKKIKLAQNIGFKNINIDLIYALKNQTLKDLEYDLEQFLKLNISHISTYSLIIEPNTKLYIDQEINVDQDLDSDMYDMIKEKLKNNGYIHYETSNFATLENFSKHNLVYWNNKEYYGFGLGASGYIDSTRYENTRSWNKYLKEEFVKEEEKLNQEKKIYNHIMLGFRKVQGINKKEFKNLYNIDIYEVKNIDKLLKEGKLKENVDYIYIDEKYIYIANEILLEILYE